MTFTSATEEKVTIHPEKGVPQLYMDQLNIIGRHLYELKTGETFIDMEEDNGKEARINFVKESTEGPTITKQPPKKKRKLGTQFTRKQLKLREDWL